MSKPGDSAGLRIGRYTLEKKIATGGMAEIFLAWCEGPGGFRKRCVIKRVRPDRLDNADNINMFLDEARLAARFRHRNLVQVYELQKVNGQYILVMEYLDGIDLDRLLLLSKQQQQFIPPAIAAYITAEIAAGLHYAHELRSASGKALNLVHRDISPGNVLLTHDGDVKVLDFGIAKHSDSSTVTQSGALKGNICYMSPEQIRSLPVDRRADLFALGAVLYEMLTLRACFARDRSIETLAAVANALYKPISEHNPAAPEALVQIVRKLLKIEAVQRYATAAEVESDLKGWLKGVGAPGSKDLRELIQARHAGAAKQQQPSTASSPRAEIQDEDDTLRMPAFVPDEQDTLSDIQLYVSEVIPAAEDTLRMRRPPNDLYSNGDEGHAPDAAPNLPLPSLTTDED